MKIIRRDKYSWEKIPTVTETDLSRFETKIGFSLPSDYRKFLSEYNGGEPFENFLEIKTKKNTIGTDVSHFLAITNEPSWASIIAQLDLHNEYFPKETIPIAADSTGNYFLLELNQGQILFWDHEYEEDNIRSVADSFDDFTKMLKVYEDPDEDEIGNAMNNALRLANKIEVVKFIDKYGVNAKSKSGKTILDRLVGTNHYELVIEVLKYNPDLNNAHKIVKKGLSNSRGAIKEMWQRQAELLQIRPWWRFW